MYKINACSVTNRGVVREINEDTFFINNFVPETADLQICGNENYINSYDKETETLSAFLAVFDGMGGMNSGEVASSIAAHSFREILNKLEQSSNDINISIQEIQSYSEITNRAIYDNSMVNRELVGMGTTFVCLCVQDRHAVVLNVGDSRAYHLCDEVVSQLSTDHSRAAQDYRNKRISLEEFKTSEDRNKLTRFLGMSSDYGRMVCAVSDIVLLKENERFLLCSDGIFDVLDDDKIAQIMHEGSTNECAQNMIAEAISFGSTDNLTAIIVDIERYFKDDNLTIDSEKSEVKDKKNLNSLICKGLLLIKNLFRN